MNDMKTRNIMILCVLAILLTGNLVSMSAKAGGPPLKDNSCAACHDDLGALVPQIHPSIGNFESCMLCHTTDSANQEATKFSTEIHKVHKNEKANLECSTCHVR